MRLCFFTQHPEPWLNPKQVPVYIIICKSYYRCENYNNLQILNPCLRARCLGNLPDLIRFTARTYIIYSLYSIYLIKYIYVNLIFVIGHVHVHYITLQTAKGICYHYLKKWLDARSAPSHFFKQCWLRVDYQFGYNLMNVLQTYIVQSYFIFT